jgi:hypothetical protein
MVCDTRPRLSFSTIFLSSISLLTFISLYRNNPPSYSLRSTFAPAHHQSQSQHQPQPTSKVMIGYPRAPFDGSFSATARQAPAKNVVIDAGPSLEQYHLPASLLAYYSGYFKNALNGPWKESNGEPIKLDDVSPAVFNLFVNWLYRQKLPCMDHHRIAEAGEGSR